MKKNQIAAIIAVGIVLTSIGQSVICPMGVYAEDTNISESWGDSIPSDEKKIVKNIVMTGFKDAQSFFNANNFNNLFNNYSDQESTICFASYDLSNYIFENCKFFNENLELDINDYMIDHSIDSQYSCIQSENVKIKCDYNKENTTITIINNFSAEGYKLAANYSDDYKFNIKLNVPITIVTRSVLDSKYLDVDESKYTEASYSNFKEKLDILIDKMKSTKEIDYDIEGKYHNDVEKAYNNLVLKTDATLPIPKPTTTGSPVTPSTPKPTKPVTPSTTTGSAVKVNKSKSHSHHSSNTGWKHTIDGDRYIKKHHFLTGWFTWDINNATYYLDDKTGYKYIGWHLIENKWYYFDKDGHMVTGWLTDDNKTYYLSEHKETLGAKQTGWINYNNKKYYSFNSGILKSSWLYENLSGHDRWYYFDCNGEMFTGWITLNKLNYYLKENGEMATGWQKINDKWYYFNCNGVMQSNCKINGYELNSSGVWIG